MSAVVESLPASNERTRAQQRSQANRRRNHLYDRLFFRSSQFFAISMLVVLAGIIASLFVGSLPAIKAFGLHFLVSDDWDPVQNRFGALVPIIGTLVTSAIAMIIAIPVSFGIAVFLTELAPLWIRRPLGTAIELLAAVPSIIYGMWGLFVLAPILADHVQPWIIQYIGAVPVIGRFFQGAPMGIGVFTAGGILSIMVIPFISAVMRDVFEVVPIVYKESCYALGATTWEVVWHVVLPYTKVGVVGGIMLGLGRALGETMAVTFVIGNAHQLGTLMEPGNSIASALANEFTEAVGDLYTSALIELGLLLGVITFVVLALAKLMLMRLGRLEGEKT